MRLENILALTHAKLVNKPFVNDFTDIVFDVKQVKRGDLFIAFDEDMIELAILNGAYGILFSKPTQITDSEIAWIKVQDIDEALKRLLRFRLIDKEVVAYETNEIVLKLALQVVTETSFIAIEGDTKELFKLLWGVESATVILFCPTLTNRDLFTKTIELSSQSFTHINIIEQTLFETSFIYDDIFYERQHLSPFFMPYLEILLNLFKNLKINYRLKKFTALEHFEPVFTNKNFEPKEFGTSDKVLIFEKSNELVKAEILYLQQGTAWAKTLYLLPHSQEKLVQSLENDKSIIFYKNTDEIVTLLKQRDFHFALIIGAEKSILSKPLNSQAEVSLFDLHSL